MFNYNVWMKDWCEVKVLKLREEWEFLFLSSFTDLKSTLWTFHRQFISEMLSTLKHMEAMLVTSFTLVFVTVYDSYVMLLYMLLLLLDKVPKYMSETKPL